VRRWRWKQVGRGLGFAIALALVTLVIDAWTSLGHRATGERLARGEHSPEWSDGHFENPEPLVNHMGRALLGLFSRSPDVSPRSRVQVVPTPPERFDTPPPTGLRVTWFGHSSLLLEIDGHQVLTDPAWSERASPSSWLGPKRWYPRPFDPARLQHLELVLISHDHYDHLDRETILALLATPARFAVPLGVGAHLEYWGVPAARIIELDWWQRTNLGDFTLVCTPARHASGRHVFDKDSKLWAGYALLGNRHRVYFSGDTGLFKAMRAIGERLGPFDLTLIEAGQYNAAWPDWHIGPEQAVEAHLRVKGKLLLPIHWGLFTLAYHAWTEPVERVLVAASAANVSVLTPPPGESVEPDLPYRNQRWWPEIPWESARISPIVSGNSE
jgi:L-ascorbate metabolism protein UlaG (beta-lactamase superfamily)